LHGFLTDSAPRLRHHQPGAVSATAKLPGHSALTRLGSAGRRRSAQRLKSAPSTPRFPSSQAAHNALLLAPLGRGQPSGLLRSRGDPAMARRDRGSVRPRLASNVLNPRPLYLTTPQYLIHPRHAIAGPPLDADFHGDRRCARSSLRRRASSFRCAWGISLGSVGKIQQTPLKRMVMVCG
jgi:hypothetical protein